LARCGSKDVVFAGIMTMRNGTISVVPVALGLMIGIAYLGYAHIQRQIKVQHAELQSLKDTQRAELQSLNDKIQGMSARSRTDVEQSQPSINEIHGLLNHVEQPKKRHPKQQKQ
jgi:hypothetical protein